MGPKLAMVGSLDVQVASNPVCVPLINAKQELVCPTKRVAGQTTSKLGPPGRRVPRRPVGTGPPPKESTENRDDRLAPSWRLKRSEPPPECRSGEGSYSVFALAAALERGPERVPAEQGALHALGELAHAPADAFAIAQPDPSNDKPLMRSPSSETRAR